MKELAQKWMTEGLQGLGRVALLFVESVQSVFRRKPSGDDLLYQLYFIGAKSQSVVLITGAFTGTVVVTHDMRSTRRVGRRVLMHNNGRIHASGTPEELFQSADPVVHRFVNGISDPKDHYF